MAALQVPAGSILGSASKRRTISMCPLSAAKPIAALLFSAMLTRASFINSLTISRWPNVADIMNASLLFKDGLMAGCWMRSLTSSTLPSLTACLRARQSSREGSTRLSASKRAAT